MLNEKLLMSIYSNARLHEICGTSDLSSFIKSQQRNYAMHVIKMPWERSVKSLMFNDDRDMLRGRPSKKLIDQVTQNEHVSMDQLCNLALGKKFGRSTWGYLLHLAIYSIW